MLERVDRMQLAVTDRQLAARTFERLFAARPLREDVSEYLNARRTLVAMGESELELCEPAGAGPVDHHLKQWGEGLFAAGFSTSDLDGLAARLTARGAAFTRERDQLHLPAGSTAGFPMVISRHVERRGQGPVSFFYEATNTLQSDWRQVAARYAELFGLDAGRFSPIESERFGYSGTLTLFDPPARLDRIELSQTFADKPTAMRRFVERRGGDSLYMCYLETHDFDALKARLLEGGATLIPRGASIAGERDGLWVHPKSLHGLLLGVSRTSYAWNWSGRPGLVRPLA